MCVVRRSLMIKSSTIIDDMYSMHTIVIDNDLTVTYNMAIN